MPKFYFTFGQIHAHSINGKTFDKDCVAVVTAENEGDARNFVRDATDNLYHQSYDKIEDVQMEYYPRGLMEMN